MRRNFVAYIVLMTLALLGTRASAAVVVHLDQNAYSITPGQSFQVNVLLDADSNTPGDQPLAAGLFSMGFKMSFNAAYADAISPSSIVLPTALSTNGLGGPALTQVGPGFAGAAGAVDVLATQGYGGTLLATITIKDLGASSSYTLDLEGVRNLSQVHSSSY